MECFFNTVLYCVNYFHKENIWCKTLMLQKEVSVFMKLESKQKLSLFSTNLKKSIKWIIINNLIINVIRGCLSIDRSEVAAVLLTKPRPQNQVVCESFSIAPSSNMRCTFGVATVQPHLVPIVGDSPQQPEAAVRDQPRIPIPPWSRPISSDL